MGLGYMGEYSKDKASEYFSKVLKLDVSHQGAIGLPLNFLVTFSFKRKSNKQPLLKKFTPV